MTEKEIDYINPIAPDFTLEEFRCPCGCGIAKPAPLMVKRLQATRTIIDRAIIITSGSRCARYNKEIGGSDTSTHVPIYMPDQYSHGADIEVLNSTYRFHLVHGLLVAGFTRIGVYDNFVHVDDFDLAFPGSELKQPTVMWRKKQ